MEERKEKEEVIEKIYNMVKSLEDLSDEPIALTLLINKGDVYFLEAGINTDYDDEEPEPIEHITKPKPKPISFNELSNYIG